MRRVYGPIIAFAAVLLIFLAAGTALGRGFQPVQSLSPVVSSPAYIRSPTQYTQWHTQAASTCRQHQAYIP